MVKLYPPVLEGTLPAFYSDENGIVNITIPFSMNRAVSHTQVGGFELKIKTVQNGTFLYTLQTFDFNKYDVENTNTYVTFQLQDNEGLLKMGQFYKLQLAYWYIDSNFKIEQLDKYYHGEISLEEYKKSIFENGEVGYYSGTSTAKYTTKPIVEILDLRKGFFNAYTSSYIGRYSQTDETFPLLDANGNYIYETDKFGNPTEQIKTRLYKRDITEKVYTYRFDIYDENDMIIYTSGDCLHNSSTDTNAEFSEDKYAFNFEIPNDTIYYIQYSITTLNNLTISTPRYKLIKRAAIAPMLAVKLNAELNFSNGYIDLSVSNERDNNNLPVAVTGSFVLLRSSSDGYFENWSEVFRFKLANQRLPDGILYKDFTVEQGKSYRYAIQQYSSNNVFSSKISSNNVYVDFEDAFLYDGKRQLKIRFNPKMSKFTNTRLESKTDTIGSKYPFIFRNAHVDYHEFSLSGLISYLSDEEFLFVTREEIGFEDDPHRHYSNTGRVSINFENEVSENVTRERLFKMKVLEWLNDGEPKLFRSPTEGNFIIRLMKTSLAPQEKLGRLLHTFNSTAYEVAEFNHKNLCDLKFLDPSEPNNLIVNWMTVDLADIASQRENKTVNINPHTFETIRNIQTVRFDNMIPGEQIKLTFANGTSDIVVIGPTGKLYIDKVMPIDAITIIPSYQLVKAFNVKDYFDDKYYLRSRDNIYFKGAEKDPDTKEIVLIPDRTYSKTYYKKSNEVMQGLLTFSYYVEQVSTFDNIADVKIEDSVIREFIGEHDILTELTKVPKLNDSLTRIPNTYIDNPKTNIIDLYYLKIKRRPVEATFYESGNYFVAYGNVKSSNKIHLNRCHPHTLFFVNNWNSGDGPYYDEFYSNFSEPYLKQYKNYDASIVINGEKIIVDRDMEISLKDFGDITELRSNNGVVVEIAYLERKITYAIEQKHNSFIGANSYETIWNNFLKHLSEGIPQYNTFRNQYIAYCNRLYNILSG